MTAYVTDCNCSEGVTIFCYILKILRLYNLVQDSWVSQAPELASPLLTNPLYLLNPFMTKFSDALYSGTEKQLY